MEALLEERGWLLESTRASAVIENSEVGQESSPGLWVPGSVHAVAGWGEAVS